MKPIDKWGKLSKWLAVNFKRNKALGMYLMPSTTNFRTSDSKAAIKAVRKVRTKSKTTQGIRNSNPPACSSKVLQLLGGAADLLTGHYLNKQWDTPLIQPEDVKDHSMSLTSVWSWTGTRLIYLEAQVLKPKMAKSSPYSIVLTFIENTKLMA